MSQPKKITAEMEDGRILTISNQEFLKYFWAMFEKLPWEERPRPQHEPSGFGGPIARKPGPLATATGKPRPPPMSVMPKPSPQPSKLGSILARAKKPEPTPVRWQRKGRNAVTIFDVVGLKETASALLCNIGGREVWFPRGMLWDGSDVTSPGDKGDVVTGRDFAEDKGLLGEAPDVGDDLDDYDGEDIPF